ncbi:ABC transporter permease [uncultured Umboniibacter sp.]|uniref:ABC transporter permease n=1 Tax=uncultured Umboniibacter sp. TaxID=1798917 RepID=UPI002608CCD5|nr:ABC transporter permease [uncultured Umboniibacter sp.]
MFFEILRAAFQAVRANVLRSVLTTLGIIVGVASTIAVVSVVQGFSMSISSQFQSLGSNSLTIEAYTPFSERMQGQFSRLDNSDLEVVKQRIDGISYVTPILWVSSAAGGGIRYRTNTSSANILGTSSSYIFLDDWLPQQGRFIGSTDDDTRRKVVVIGEKVRQDLELPDDPRGEFIQLAGEWFKVVGIMEERGELLGFNQDDVVLVPYSAAESLLGRQRFANIQIRLRVTDVTQLDATKRKIERLLRQHRDLEPGDANDFKISTADQLLESFESVTDSITLVLGGIVAISLLVGGIGIMNIMLVSVTERTREIGINKALGATRSFILTQFLAEAIVLCLIGGLIGLGIGFLLGLGVAAMIPGFPSAAVPMWAIWLALGFSVSVGVVFGIVPAAKAANLSPIDALRYE